MSADNYIYIRRREDGKFGVSMRFASTYYADEGHTVASLRPQGGDETWIVPPPPDDYGTFDDVAEAMFAAHRAYYEEPIIEYGVQVAPEVVA